MVISSIFIYFSWSF